MLAMCKNFKIYNYQRMHATTSYAYVTDCNCNQLMMNLLHI